MAKSSSQERALKVYPDPKVYRLVVAHSKVRGTSISAEVTKCLRKYYDSLTDEERKDILDKSKNPLFDDTRSKQYNKNGLK